VHRFFDAGYADGHAHGRTHGLIEGRALGREKGYELWEEIGFYEGFAKFWERIHQKDKDRDNTTESRIESHIRHLLDLVSQFPRINPSAEQDANAQVDVAALLSKIRARYKTLCASLGVRPRLRVAGSGTDIVGETEGPRGATVGKKVWPLQGRQGSTELSF